MGIGAVAANAQSFLAGGITYEVKSNSTEHLCQVAVSEGEPYSGNVKIPSKVTYDGTDYTVVGINPYAFAGCEGLTAVDIPATVTELGRNAFQSCKALYSISLPTGITEIKDQTFYECEVLISYSAPGVSRIGKSAFAYCKKLKEAPFSSNTEYIGVSSFKNCYSLTTVSLPSNAEILEAAFEGCTGLKSVRLSAQMEMVPEYLFSGCTALEEVRGGEQVMEIGEYAFSDCISLTTFDLSGRLTKIHRGAFSFCSSLVMPSIKGNELEIGEYAFTGCAALEEIDFEGAVRIEAEAFANCEELKTLKFGPETKYIRERVFRGCDKIESVTCMAMQPPFLSNNSFTETVYETALLTVLESQRLLYVQTPPWSYFKNVEGVGDAGVDDVHGDNPETTISVENGNLTVKGVAGEVMVYNPEGRICWSGRVETADGEVVVCGLAPGIYIVKTRERAEKVLVR